MKYIKGELAGKTLSDFNQFDNTLKTFEERLKYVETVLGNDDTLDAYFVEYFTEYFQGFLSKSGFKADEDGVCVLLERFGTYLIKSQDVESNRKVKYRFWVDEREYNDYKDSEMTISSTVDANGKEGEAQVEIVDLFFDPKKKNQKIVGDVVVEPKDIASIEEVNALQKAIERLSSEKGRKHIREYCLSLLESGTITDQADKKRLEYIAKNTERYLTSLVKDLKANQLAIKIAVTKPLEFSSVLKDEGCDIDYSNVMDLDNKKALVIMLESLSRRCLMSDEFELVLWDLYEFLYSGKIKLAKREKQVIDLLSEGYKQKEIAETLGINKRTVSDTLSRIANKLSNCQDFFI